MTTKPKAKKFRVRRDQAAAGQPAPEKGASDRGETDNPPNPAATGATGKAQTNDAATGSTDMDAIRHEGLTGRQLRMARRLAQKHKLPATSDFDAVRLLRERGIDPFTKTNMLELVVPRAGTGPGADMFQNLPDPESGLTADGSMQLPQTVAPGEQTLPGPELSPAERREREIGQIQRDIARRRRRKLALLMTRLAFFVLLPTLIAGYYFYRVATPMYTSESEMLILQADSSAGSYGGLLSGTQWATSQDSITVQSYLMSKPAMLRLDQDLGFKAHFSQDWIDPIQRMAPDASNETAFKTYKKRVKIGFDPTEGVIRMAITAADPEIAAAFSKLLISYAEERVNAISQEKRGDQMKDAIEAFETAQEERRLAQEELVRLQLEGSVLDPEGVIATLRSQINGVEVQLQEKQLQLAALQDNLRPNPAKVEGAKGDVRRLKQLLEELNAKMVDVSKGENSLAQLSVRIQMAQADLATRDMMLQSTLQQVDQTRSEANRQVRYLTTAVEPIPSEDPSYPKKFENTVLAFLIFAGIYLMISLTASILREQVSS